MGAFLVVIMCAVPALAVPAHAHVETVPVGASSDQRPNTVSPLARDAAWSTATPGMAASFPFGLLDAVLLGLGSVVLCGLAGGAPRVLHRCWTVRLPSRRAPDPLPVEPWPSRMSPEPVSTSC